MDALEDDELVIGAEPSIPERIDLPNLRLEIGCIDFSPMCLWDCDQELSDRMQPSKSSPPRSHILIRWLAVAKNSTLISYANSTGYAAFFRRYESIISAYVRTHSLHARTN